jgi:2,3-bisphosphoglycerate-independent phosphoglycerate mutase
MNLMKLNKLRQFNGRTGPLLLIIMDGIGIGPSDDTNAVFLANTPNLDRLLGSSLYTTLQAHGTAVGLPSDEDMGNSEVGHNALGAGIITDQGAKLVNKAILSGAMFHSSLWRQIISTGVSGGTIHFLGLLSDGNVHSHISHLFAMLDECAKSQVKRARVHVLLDGRDVPDRSGLEYVRSLQNKLTSINECRGTDYAIASGGGRMKVTMDRYEADWTIVQRGWNAHVLGEGRPFSSASDAMERFYSEGSNISDQYVDAFVIVNPEGAPIGTIHDGDVVIFFNFRGDRAVEISKAFIEAEFNKFERCRFPKTLYVGMTLYDGDTAIPPHFLVSPPAIHGTLSEYLCAEGLKTFALSETQKFGHVTYFWNGNRSGYFDESLETYIEIPSDKIRFDLAPKMKANEITERTIELLRKGTYRFGRINFPNGDMVGHTGNMKATIEAVEEVDRCLGTLLPVIRDLVGIAVVTADHGNADVMIEIDKKGNRRPRTAHSLSRVPFVIYDPSYQCEYEMKRLGKAGLSNVAATLLNLLGYDKVDSYDPSLIQFKDTV